MRDALAWLAGALAPYPFETLNVVLLPGVAERAQGGGIVIVPAETPLAASTDAADLIAGQWFGERQGMDAEIIQTGDPHKTAAAMYGIKLPKIEIEEILFGHFCPVR